MGLIHAFLIYTISAVIAFYSVYAVHFDADEPTLSVGLIFTGNWVVTQDIDFFPL